MAALIKVIEGGMTTSLQDAGRLGFRHIGMSTAGALDLDLLRSANALVTNTLDTPALEMYGMGLSLQVLSGTVRMALTGELIAHIVLAAGQRLALPSGQSFTLQADDVLRVSAVHNGVGYLSIAGGLHCPSVMGSYSTYSRAQIGGIAGRSLRQGDELICRQNSVRIGKERRLAQVFRADTETPIRVLLGPQDDCFTAEALRHFTESDYIVSRDSDRMGMRLQGATLEHASIHGKSCTEIISDGISAGAIQVPPNGQPIVLLADCQTVGGYPKMATVITADLPRLGHFMPNDRLRFCIVTLEEAYQALLLRQQCLQASIEGIVEFLPAGFVDEAALYQHNLISGAINAQPTEGVYVCSAS